MRAWLLLLAVAPALLSCASRDSVGERRDADANPVEPSEAPFDLDEQGPVERGCDGAPCDNGAGGDEAH